MASALDKIKKIAKAVKEAVWAPLENSGQEIFLMAGQPETLVSEVLIHGGRGTGKSEVLIPNYLQHVGKGWGIWWTGIILRREIKSLKDLIKKSKKMIPRAFPDAEYNKSERSWTFATGEKLTFDFCKTVEDYDEKYHGQEFQYIAFDELTVWPDDKVYQAMRSCLRHSYQPTPEQPLLPPMQTRATTNPYGRGKGWVKEYFITCCQQGIPTFVDGVMDKMNIFCSYIENYKLPDVYKRFLNSIKDPVLRAAWLFGDWNSVDYSAIFGGLWSKHVEIDPFTIPKEWMVNRAYDDGDAAPFATGWFAEANGEEVKLPNGKTFCPPAGSIFLVCEDYGTEEDSQGNQVERNRGLQLTARPKAKRILAKEKKLLEGILSNHNKVEPGPADNSITVGGKRDNGTAPSVKKEMEAVGLKWLESYKASGSRRMSAQIMIERLSATKEQDPERPHIYIFKTCKYSLKFLPELHRDDSKPDEVAKGPDDHLWDMIAYRLTQKAKPKTIARKGFF